MNALSAIQSSSRRNSLLIAARIVVLVGAVLFAVEPVLGIVVASAGFYVGYRLVPQETDGG